MKKAFGERPPWNSATRRSRPETTTSSCTATTRSTSGRARAPPEVGPRFGARLPSLRRYGPATPTTSARWGYRPCQGSPNLSLLVTSELLILLQFFCAMKPWHGLEMMLRVMKPKLVTQIKKFGATKPYHVLELMLATAQPFNIRSRYLWMELWLPPNIIYRSKISLGDIFYGCKGY